MILYISRQRYRQYSWQCQLSYTPMWVTARRQCAYHSGTFCQNYIDKDFALATSQ